MTYEIKKKYTRKIDREYTSTLLEGAESGKEDGKTKYKINPQNVLKANDYLIRELYDMTQEEVDNLEVKTYESLLKEVEKVKDFQ